MQSRTSKSIKNSVVALSFYVVNLALQFFSRKIFLDHLGTEVLGLNTTAMNLLQFLNLAELGIGAAVACTLYKPLLDRNTTTVNEIVSLQGWMYRRIALAVAGGAAVLMCFFPWIFAKMPLPMWYAYASFGVLLVSALLSYFVNYKQVVLSADQKEYKIQYSYKAAMSVKILAQLLAIKYFEDGYIWWLGLEVIFAIIASLLLNRTIRRTYPDLKTDLSQGRELSRKYPDIITKIKQLFFHKIGGFALTQTSPIIIYAYTSLTLVALYGNYMLIIMGITVLMGAVFNSMNAGVGNLVAEGNKTRIMEVFEELFSIRFLVTCVLCFGTYTLTPAFVTLWLGAEYVMDNTTLLLMVAIMYINLSRSVVEAYTFAYGLFSDIWAPVTEATINIGMSVLLGYFFGLHGILTGVLLSLIIIIFGWKPYFLFRKGLKEQLRKYVWMYIKHLFATMIAYLVARYLLSLIAIDSAHSITAFLSYGVLCIVTYAVILFILLYAITKGMRDFVYRVKHIISSVK